MAFTLNWNSQAKDSGEIIPARGKAAVHGKFRGVPRQPVPGVAAPKRGAQSGFPAEMMLAKCKVAVKPAVDAPVKKAMHPPGAVHG